MTYSNFVQATVSVPLSPSDTLISLAAVSAPFNLPPAGGGVLVLADSIGRPTVVEVISYTSRSGQNLLGVVRGLEGTTAVVWGVGNYIYQPITAGLYQSDLDGKLNASSTTDAVAEGPTNKYFTAARVLATVLAGLSTATSSAITVADSVLTGLGKLQAQITSLTSSKLDSGATAAAATKLATTRKINGVNFDGTVDITIADGTKEPAIGSGTSAQFWSGSKSWTDFTGTALAVVLTGLSVATTTAVVATDSLLAALGKMQGQLNLKAAAGSNTDITAMSALATLTSSKLSGKQLSMVGYLDKTVVNATATGTVTLDCSLASVFDLTMTGNTTLAFSNVPTLSGENFAVLVKVRQGGTAYTLTQPSGVTPITAGGANPATPGASKRADYIYSTTNGTAWDWYAGAST